MEQVRYIGYPSVHKLPGKTTIYYSLEQVHGVFLILHRNNNTIDTPNTPTPKLN